MNDSKERDRSLITGRGGDGREGGQVKFYSYGKGGGGRFSNAEGDAQKMST